VQAGSLRYDASRQTHARHEDPAPPKTRAAENALARK